MLKIIEEGSHYRNVFTKDRVQVLSVQDDIVRYKKDIPNTMYSCFLRDERTIMLKSIDETIIIGKVVETKRIQQITRGKEKAPIDNIVSEFNKPVRVFNQTYMI